MYLDQIVGVGRKRPSLPMDFNDYWNESPEEAQYKKDFNVQINFNFGTYRECISDFVQVAAAKRLRVNDTSIDTMD